MSFVSLTTFKNVLSVSTICRQVNRIAAMVIIYLLHCYYLNHIVFFRIDKNILLFDSIAIDSLGICASVIKINDENLFSIFCENMKFFVLFFKYIFIL